MERKLSLLILVVAILGIAAMTTFGTRGSPPTASVSVLNSQIASAATATLSATTAQTAVFQRYVVSNTIKNDDYGPPTGAIHAILTTSARFNDGPTFTIASAATPTKRAMDLIGFNAKDNARMIAELALSNYNVTANGDNRTTAGVYIGDTAYASNNAQTAEIANSSNTANNNLTRTADGGPQPEVIYIGDMHMRTLDTIST